MRMVQWCQAPRVGRWMVTLGLLVGMTTLGWPAVGDDDPKLSEYYGFLPVEIYKLEDRIGNPRVADLDGDQIGDVVIANNARSRIDLLLSGPAPVRVDSSVARKKPNELNNERRMRLVSVPVNMNIVSLRVGEFNGDDKPDLVLYGTPAEILVLRNEDAKEGRLTEGRRLEVGDGVDSELALNVADVNRDGRDDLVLLRKTELVVFLQGQEGAFQDPLLYPHTAPQPRGVFLADVDRDGGPDFVVWGEDREAPLRARLTNAKGVPGPELRLALDRVRDIQLANIDGKPGDELIAIESQSGRVQVMELKTTPRGDASNVGRLVFYPLPEGSARDRACATGDLDGDGKVDVVISDPGNAQLLVHRQDRSGLGPATSYPTLIGVKTLMVGDVDGDSRAEVLVYSPREKQVGLSRFADDRLTFATPLTTVGTPMALSLADLNVDGRRELVYVTKAEDAKSGDPAELRALTWPVGQAPNAAVSAGAVAFRWGDQESVPLKLTATAKNADRSSTTSSLASLLSEPKDLQMMDVNQDGINDYLFAGENGLGAVMLGRAQAAPELVLSPLGPLANAETVGLTALSGPLAQGGAAGSSVLVAQSAVARQVVLQPDKTWKILDQFNPGRAGAQIQGVIAMDLREGPELEIVLWDRTSKKLLILARRDGVFRPVATVDVGAINFLGFQTADFSGDGRLDLMLAGSDKFAILLNDSEGLRFVSISSYESARKEARFGHAQVGDLNADSVADLVLADVVEHFLEIAAFARGSELVPALSFPVFEKKSFTDIDDLLEPREMTIGDVDGDQRQDLVVIVHDRVLIYRQDSGEAPPMPPKSTDTDTDTDTTTTTPPSAASPR